MIAPFLVRYINHRVVLTIGIASMSAGCMAASYLTDLHAIIVCVAVPIGMSFSFCYMVPMQACNELMPEYKGRVAGIILCCFSLGSLLFNTIISYLCNPDGESPINENGNT